MIGGWELSFSRASYGADMRTSSPAARKRPSSMPTSTGRSKIGLLGAILTSGLASDIAALGCSNSTACDVDLCFSPVNLGPQARTTAHKGRKGQGLRDTALACARGCHVEADNTRARQWRPKLNRPPGVQAADGITDCALGRARAALRLLP